MGRAVAAHKQTKMFQYHSSSKCDWKFSLKVSGVISGTVCSEPHRLVHPTEHLCMWLWQADVGLCIWNWALFECFRKEIGRFIADFFWSLKSYPCLFLSRDQWEAKPHWYPEKQKQRKGRCWCFFYTSVKLKCWICATVSCPRCMHLSKWRLAWFRVVCKGWGDVRQTVFCMVWWEVSLSLSTCEMILNPLY